ncbi:MAG TPA: hypothetical protein VMH89_03625, partial [Candidatus Acidoferrum sp.]|nr:hypothetical protein [Candidatus Acidoferrum sp.]
MSINTEVLKTAKAAPMRAQSNATTRVDVPELIDLAVRGLGPMFNEKEQLFCYRRTKTPSGMQQEGLSPRYTIMTLLGLIEYEKAGGTSPFAIDSLLDRLLENRAWPEGAGDFGLLAWLTAVRAPKKLPALFSRFDVSNAFEKYQDLRNGNTMEMAWFLTGLSYVAMAAQSGVPDIRGLAEKTFRALVKNQGLQFFGHLDRSQTNSGKIRGWMGSFADQVYPILAFTRYSQAFHSKDAQQLALECARGICREQGALGQWWWHYDSRMGRVASMYPVFSVHQDAMAPMVLFAAGEATGEDFREYIYLGLDWVGGQNELGRDLRDTEHNLVWRRIHPVPESSMQLDVLASHFHIYRKASTRSMDILWESRPYHLG